MNEMSRAGSEAALNVPSAVSHTGSQTARAGPAGRMTQATSVQAAIARSDVAGHASHLLWMHVLASTPTAAPPRPARPIVPSAEVVAPEPRLPKAEAAGAQPSPPMLSRYSVLASRQPALRVRERVDLRVVLVRERLELLVHAEHRPQERDGGRFVRIW